MGSEKFNSITKESRWKGKGIPVKGLAYSYPHDQLQEAALSAIAALAKGNTVVATVLTKSPHDRESKIAFLLFQLWSAYCLAANSPLASVLSLTKSRSTEVQLAACLWYDP